MVAISDAQFRIGVVAGGISLAVAITALRFCGSVSLPPKPAPSATWSTSAPQSQSQLLSKSAASPAAYRDNLLRDAASAEVAVPSLEDMGRKLPYRVDDARHVLEVGGPVVAVAGLELAAVRIGDAIGLDIRNAIRADVAYLVETAPTPAISGCNRARALPFDAMILGRNEALTRVECVWRDDLTIVVSRVETVELTPIGVWYVDQVPPAVVGIDERIARGHRPSRVRQMCAPILGQAVRTGVEQGEIGWRDLIDFYARHRCETYQFPLGYRAFTKNDQRTLPALASDR